MGFVTQLNAHGANARPKGRYWKTNTRLSKTKARKQWNSQPMGTWKKASCRSRVQPHMGSRILIAIDWTDSILKWGTTRNLLRRERSRTGRNVPSFFETRKSLEKNTGW